MATLLKNAEQRPATTAKEERARDAALAMQEYEAEKLAISAKTARLRALRLAKEAEARERTSTKNTRTKTAISSFCCLSGLTSEPTFNAWSETRGNRGFTFYDLSGDVLKCAARRSGRMVHLHHCVSGAARYSGDVRTARARLISWRPDELWHQPVRGLSPSWPLRRPYPEGREAR